jgi:hypothetical protein
MGRTLAQGVAVVDTLVLIKCEAVVIALARGEREDIHVALAFALAVALAKPPAATAARTARGATRTARGSVLHEPLAISW